MATTKPRKVRNEEAAPYLAPNMLTDEQLMHPTILDRIALLAAKELSERPTLNNPLRTRQLLIAKMRNQEAEMFGALFLTSQHGVIADVILFTGTIDGASVYPREVVKAALQHNAAAVVFYHNHPSGSPEPSTADRQITRRLTDALALIDIRVLDHHVVSQGASVSMAERGLI